MIYIYIYIYISGCCREWVVECDKEEMLSKTELRNRHLLKCVKLTNNLGKSGRRNGCCQFEKM